MKTMAIKDDENAGGEQDTTRGGGGDCGGGCDMILQECVFLVVTIRNSRNGDENIVSYR